MIIVMQTDASENDVGQVVAAIRAKGLSEHVSHGEECTIIGAIGDERVFHIDEIERLPKVQKAIRILHNWRLVSREVQNSDTILTVRGIRFGGGVVQTVQCHLKNSFTSSNAVAVWLDPFYVPANPYAVASSDLTDERHITRTLHHTIEQYHQHHQAVFVRIRDSRQIEIALTAEADILCLGGELMDNHSVLYELGNLNTPVVLYKNKHHTVHDWLTAAEQVVLRGNRHIILGEAGTMNLHGEPLRLDSESIVKAKQLSHLPVLADISALTHRYMDEITLFHLAQAAGADIIVCQTNVKIE